MTTQLAVSRLGRSPRLLGALLGALISLACDRRSTPDTAEPSPTSQASPDAGRPSAHLQRTEPDPLVPPFLTRALRALESELPPEVQLLEIRATPRVVELHVLDGDEVRSIRYEEVRRPGARLAPPQGRILGPDQVPVYGNGDLEANAFSPEEVQLDRITHAFPVAVKAVDPDGGWVSRLIVRRYLPFGTAVRARIYVESPRMPGSIDTNANGVPLK